VLQYHFNWKTISVAAAMTLWNVTVRGTQGKIRRDWRPTERESSSRPG
jgi:hypothetical protein